MIVIVGVGALGTRVCKLLKEEDHVVLIDHDIVLEKNVGLQYPLACVGMRKVDACVRAYHPNAEAIFKHLDLTTVGLLADASIVLDCTDNMVSRAVINDYCSREGIPWIHGALSDTAGTVASFQPGGPCFSCVYPPSKGSVCTEALDTTVADRTAALMVEELHTFLAGALRSEFYRVDHAGARSFTMTKRPGCKTCAGTYDALEHDQQFYITYCVNAHCMAAKPTKDLHHDHGTPMDRKVAGVRLSIFPNGEIHFHDERDADELQAIAREVYASLRHSRSDHPRQNL